MKGITHIDYFIDEPACLFDVLNTSIIWDERMTARKTASFGKAYNYSQMAYPYKEFLPELNVLIKQVEPVIGFEPNNCLINYYPDGKSKMGYHSDQTDILVEGTGIAIISLGETRTLKFRNIEDPEQFLSYDLASGSLIYMTKDIQKAWQHSITKATTNKGRLSLTFREIK